MVRLTFFQIFFGVLVALALVAPDAAEAMGPKKENKCSDGVDNDGDGLIDGADPDCGGDGGGNPTDPTPSELTFRDGATDGLLSDVLTTVTPHYVDGVPANLEVFIGSAGNIFLRNIDLNDPGARQIRIAVPANSDPACFLPNGTTSFFDLKFLVADVESVVNGGAFGIGDGPDNSVSSPMKARFFHGGNAYQLLFQPAEKGPCKGISTPVRVEKNGSTWTVTDQGPVCVEKAKNRNDKAIKCFMGEMDFSFDITTLP